MWSLWSSHNLGPKYQFGGFLRLPNHNFAACSPIDFAACSPIDFAACSPPQQDDSWYLGLGMDVRDIFKSRQLSSQLYFQKSCQGNWQVNCVSKFFFQGNFQVHFFPTNLSRQLSSQLCDTIFFFKAVVKSIIFKKIILCLLSIIVIFMLILVNYG